MATGYYKGRRLRTGGKHPARFGLLDYVSVSVQDSTNSLILIVDSWLWQICHVVSKKRFHPLSNTDPYSAAAIALTQQRRMAPRNTLLAYHFHSFSDAETWTLGAVLRNILHQLASQSDSVCNDLTTLFKTCGSGSRRPTDGELAGLLKATLSYGAETYIFLDALDESDEKFELVELLESLQSQSQNLHLFLTSRRHVAFIDAIESGKYYEIRMERGAVNQDIERYVQHQLLSDLTLRKFSSALQVNIRARLSSANGM